MKEKHLFRKPLLERVMEAISNMSRRASAIYLAILSLIFLVGLAMVLVGAIYIPLDESGTPDFAWPLAISGAIVMLVDCAVVAVTTLSSNYVKSRQQKREEGLKAKAEAEAAGKQSPSDSGADDDSLKSLEDPEN